MIYSAPPEGFSPEFEVCSVFLEADGFLLLLKRSDQKAIGPSGWANAGGKLEPGESPQEAGAREVLEETGIDIGSATLLETLYAQYPKNQFVLHLCGASLPERSDVVIESEHTEYRWVRPVEALLMPLIPDHDICVRRWLRLR